VRVTKNEGCDEEYGTGVGSVGIVAGSDVMGCVLVNFPNYSERGMFPEQLELVGSVQSTKDVRFILQYELDRDPFETFSTMQEVEDRIKELAKRPDLKREGIKVYEVSKTYDVEIESRVLFNLFGQRVKVTEKPMMPNAENMFVKKRGRPALTERQRKARQSSYKRDYYKRRKENGGAPLRKAK